ncbi:MAG TPA: ABC transporter permease [Balneolaceae bacterium]|nr:ABC transporter permease [Balneolaceae bacterium]
MQLLSGFIIKEFRHILRDRKTLLLLFGLPIAMLLIFGFAIRYEVNEAEVAILDKSKDEITQQIIRKIDASSEMTVTRHLLSESMIDEVFLSGDIKEVIVFEEDFMRSLERGNVVTVEVITDASEPNMAGLLQQYTNKIITSWDRENDVRVVSSNRMVSSSARMFFNPDLESVNYFVPGLIAVILMLVSTQMTSLSIAREKESGSMEVLLVSPLKPYHIIIGKVIPYFLLSLINVYSVLLMAYFVFGVPFEGSILFFTVISLLFIFVALALGLLISTRTETQRTAIMLSMVINMLPTIILSGFVFPIDSMPWILQLLSNVVPAKWYLIVVRGSMLVGSGLEYLWMESAILLGMTLFFVTVGIKNFNDRLE